MIREVKWARYDLAGDGALGGIIGWGRLRIFQTPPTSFLIRIDIAPRKSTIWIRNG